MTINSIINSTSAASERFHNDSNLITCDRCGCVIEGESFDVQGETFCVDCEECFTSECDGCGGLFRDDDLTYVDCAGEHYCETCLDDRFTTCECCGEYVDRDYANWCEDDQSVVCDDCVYDGSSYFRCERCGKIHSTNDAEDVYCNDDSSERWCSHCAEWHACYCEECNRYFDTNYVEVDNDVCEYCGSAPQTCDDIAYWEAPYGVRSYSYKPDPCFCLTLEEMKLRSPAEIVCFGVELEMEDRSGDGRDLDADADYMNRALRFTYCKHDGSLTDGIELVSHPASFDYWMEHKDVLAKVFKEMRKRGFTSHDNGDCGLHVHFSVKPFLEANPSADCAMIFLFEKFWPELVRFSRRTESQLDRWAWKYPATHKQYERLAELAKGERDRYMAVNLTNKHTIELRIFRGTLRVETFIATLQLVKRLVNVCMTSSLDQLRALTWQELIGDEYEELTAYCALRFKKDEAAAEAAQSDAERVQSDAERVQSEPLFEVPGYAEMHALNLHVGDRIVVSDGAPTASFRGERGVIGTGGIDSLRLVQFDSGTCRAAHTRHLIREEPAFREGDWVRVLQNSTNYTHCCQFSSEIQAGWVGRVVCMDNTDSIGVEFPQAFEGGHHCGGHTTTGHGQWIPADNLVLL